MTSPAEIEDLALLLTDEELGRIERKAWVTASRAWTRYQQSLWRDDPLETTNLLNSLAWEAEHLWRALNAAREGRRQGHHASR